MTSREIREFKQSFQELDGFLVKGSKLSDLSEEKRFSLYESCFKYLSIFCFEGKERKADSEAVFFQGGSPIHVDHWPLDKDSREMLYLGRFESSRVAVPFSLYISTRFQDYSAKSRSWFSILPESSSAEPTRASIVPPEVEKLDERSIGSQVLLDIFRYDELIGSSFDSVIKSELKTLLEQYNQLHNSELTKDFVEARLKRFKEARQRAAFHANGISFSDTRANDSHYQHLIEDSKNWLVFLVFRENSLLKLTGNRDILLLINKNNYQSGNFDKGILIII